MPYLIDGHNLIPHIPDLSLKDLDDETALIQLLQGFAKRSRSKVEVFFDQAPAGGAGSRSFGSVRAHFVRQDTTADQAIVKRLSQLGKEAKNWTVVTSDREILAEARSIHSQVIGSVDFARKLNQRKASDAGIDKGEDPEVSSGEVEFWLNQFKSRGSDG
jgi:predicted RNA-binding protein with PIN domain